MHRAFVSANSIRSGPSKLSSTGIQHMRFSTPTVFDNASSTPVYVTYTIQRGDTLSAIAKKYGCTVLDIVAANSSLIKRPNLICAGWQLNIPLNGITGATNAKITVYIVKQGDSLWLIARKHGCTIAEIAALNSRRISNLNLIYVGWTIQIPQK